MSINLSRCCTLHEVLFLCYSSLNLRQGIKLHRTTVAYLSRKSGFASPMRNFAPFHVAPLSRLKPVNELEQGSLWGKSRGRTKRPMGLTSTKVLCSRLQRDITKFARLAYSINHTKAIHRLHNSEVFQTFGKVICSNGRSEAGDVQPFGDRFVHCGRHTVRGSSFEDWDY